MEGADGAAGAAILEDADRLTSGAGACGAASSREGAAASSTRFEARFVTMIFLVRPALTRAGFECGFEVEPVTIGSSFSDP